MATVKKLRVCLSSKLPDIADRDPNYIYFAFDKLLIFQGVNPVPENFVIADQVPEKPVYGIMYILTDGTVHKIIDYSDTIIANIEDKSQIQYLKDAGNIYFNNSDHRYIDHRSRSMVLPYSDGSYQLVTSVKNDGVYNNESYLSYNDQKEEFELNSDSSREWYDFSTLFKGGTTDTANTKVDGTRILAEVKISSIINNLLKVTHDGLYVDVSNKVDAKEYDEWVEELGSFKKRTEGILENINNDLMELEALVTPEKITADIASYLSGRIPEIQSYIDNYQSILNSLNATEADVMSYAESTIANASINISENAYKSGTWENLDDSHETFKQEIDYYGKTIRDEDKVPLTEDDITSTIISAISAYLSSTGDF